MHVILCGGYETRDLRRWLFDANAPRPVILVRLLVGCVFFSEGVQKFLFPAALGVGRFQKIGIPAPQFVAPFVGMVEIVFGFLVIVGLLTRLTAIPLLIDISVAIATTKIPMLAKSGLWATLHEARTDFCMFLGSIFLIACGGGGISLDAMLGKSENAAGRTEGNRSYFQRSRSAIHGRIRSRVADSRRHHRLAGSPSGRRHCRRTGGGGKRPGEINPGD